MSLESAVLRMDEAMALLSEKTTRVPKQFASVKAKNTYYRELPYTYAKEINKYRAIFEQTLEDINMSRLELMRLLTDEEFAVNDNTRKLLEDVIGIQLEEESQQTVQ